MKIELHNVHPISLNHYEKIRIIRKGKKSIPIHYKPEKSKLFDSAIKDQLDTMHRKFKEFNDSYNKAENYLTAHYRFYIPIFTKQGTISERSGDVDNLIKPVQDLIFKYLKADDSQIIQTTTTKIQCAYSKIQIDLNIFDLSHIK